MARTKAPKRKGAAARAGKPARTAKAKASKAKAPARKAGKAAKAAKAAKGKSPKAAGTKAKAKPAARKPATKATRAARATRVKKAPAPAAKRAKPAAKRAKKVAQKAAPAPKPVAKKAPARTPAPAKAAPKAPARRPALDRDRRLVRDAEVAPSAPSSLVPNRHASAASSGADEMRVRLANHPGGQELAAGDPDADWQSAETVGDEAPGGDNPTPDQDVVEDIGRALGVQYDDDEELQGGDEIAARDHDRWELDPASSEDFDDRD